MPMFKKDGAKLADVLNAAKKGLKDLYTQLGASDNRFTSRSVRDAAERARDDTGEGSSIKRRTDL